MVVVSWSTVKKNSEALSRFNERVMFKVGDVCPADRDHRLARRHCYSGFPPPLFWGTFCFLLSFFSLFSKVQRTEWIVCRGRAVLESLWELF